MVKNRLMKFLVDENQYMRIRNNANAKGYSAISPYLRDLALNNDLKLEMMLTEIHKEVVLNGRRKD